MTLMQEETAYLVSQGGLTSQSFRLCFACSSKKLTLLAGIAHLIPISTHPTLPSPSQIAAHTASRVARLQAIEARSRAEEEVKAREREAAFEKGGEKARAKREARARAKAEQAAARVAGYADIEGGQGTMEGAVLFGGEDSATSSTVPPYSTFESSGATRETAKPITGAHFHAFPSHPHFPLLVEGEPITSLPHRLFPFPSTPRERALLAAFTSLQRLGLRMGLGPRFGGEYLIYPGDYLRYHAHFTSQVLVRNEAIRPAEIVAWGRLGTGTKKAGLLCCWDDGVRGTEEEEGKQEWEGHGQKEGQVEYYSLEWASFG
jgi:tRNA-splicing endonuclease subunit Sen34